MALYGYARCSINEELQDIDRQRRDLKKLGVKDNKIFLEYESGTKENREELNKLFNSVQKGDTIATTEVSRLTRSTKQLCEIIEFAKEKRLELIIGTFRVDCRKDLDPMTDGMLKMMGVFAEMERNMISQRVKSGMANAREKGSKLGRPAKTNENLPGIFYKHYPQYKSGKLNKVELAKLCECSYPTILKYVNIAEA